MPNIVITQNSFSGGEISPEMYSRFDDPKHQSGAKKISNFIVKPQGPIEKRTGFVLVDLVANQRERARLIPFSSSTNFSVMLVFNNRKLKAYTKDGEVIIDQPACAKPDGSPCTTEEMLSKPSDTREFGVNGGRLVHDFYQEKHLNDLKYVQSADVLTIVHDQYPPIELRRVQSRLIEAIKIEFSPRFQAPSGVKATVSQGSSFGDTNPKRFSYLYGVTAVDEYRLNESKISEAAGATANFALTNEQVTVTWHPVPNAGYYNIYRLFSGSYGFVGQSTSTEFIDSRISSDFSITPPIFEDVFNEKDSYPSCVTYFEQRRIFAATLKQPHTIWMTKPGTEASMGYSIPAKPDDRLKLRLAATDSSPIRHLVPLSNLMVLTGSTEWRVASASAADAMTAATVSARPQSYIGASNCTPVVINNTLIYVAARSNHVYECGFNMQTNGYASSDLSIRSAHLFDNDEVVEMAYSSSPTPILWCVMKSGKLLGLTYVPEQAVGAWHQHETDGIVENCAVLKEGNYDALYIIVRRMLDEKEVRTIERLSNPNNHFNDRSVYLDCAFGTSNVYKIGRNNIVDTYEETLLLNVILNNILEVFCKHADKNRLWPTYNEESGWNNKFKKTENDSEVLTKPTEEEKKLIKSMLDSKRSLVKNLIDRKILERGVPKETIVNDIVKEIYKMFIFKSKIIGDNKGSVGVHSYVAFNENTAIVAVFIKTMVEKCIDFRFKGRANALSFRIMNEFNKNIAKKMRSL